MSSRTRAIAITVIGLLVCASAGFGATTPAFATTYAVIEGSGSTWSQVILQQWISSVSASGIKVAYGGTGSSQGRKDFANSVTDFGISEIPYQGRDEFGNADTSNGRAFAYLPIVAGGTAFTYNLKVAGRRVTNLRLSGDTLAKIFTNKITSWNDPAITRDNNGHGFPAQPITPVVRSDGSGTTAQFTRYLDNMYPSIWRPFFGRSGLTSYFPKKGRTVAQSGSDQVMNFIVGAAGSGTIGYVEYSYPKNAGFPVVKVLNNGGYYVEPTQYNVAVALTQARINQDKSSQNYLTQILDNVYRARDSRAYPLSSYSYMIIPTGATDRRMTTAKRQTLADFMYYSLCTGQAKAGNYGYSPLPLNLVQAGFQQLSKLKTADPAVNLTSRSVTTCKNPTFVAGNLSRNHLAEIAPRPAACDRAGAGPCGGRTGTGTPSTDKNQKSVGAGASPTAAAGAGPEGAGATAAVDPDTGQPVAGGEASTTSDLVSASTDLSSARAGDSSVFGTFAVLELIALVILPGILLAARGRRSKESS